MNDTPVAFGVMADVRFSGKRAKRVCKTETISVVSNPVNRTLATIPTTTRVSFGVIQSMCYARSSIRRLYVTCGVSYRHLSDEKSHIMYYYR